MRTRELERKFGWGVLMHHHAECEDCGGSGLEDCDDPDSEPCALCDGEGRIFWGSFYTADHGECGYCKSKHDVPIAALYDGGNEYVCLRCYIKHHHNSCGCDLWKKAEACIPSLRLKPLTKVA